MSGLLSEARNLIDIYVNDRLADIESEGVLSPQCVIGALMESRGVIIKETGRGGRDSAMINAVAKMQTAHTRSAEAHAYLTLIKPKYAHALVFDAFMSRQAEQTEIAEALGLTFAEYRNAKERGIRKVAELIGIVSVIDRARGVSR